MRYPDYLMHHGIKGMKWGVRRFQNKDGSYTPLGLKRERGGSGGSGGSGRARAGSGSNAEARKARIKKGLKIAAGVAGAAAVGYGAYRLAKSKKGQEVIGQLRQKGAEVMSERHSKQRAKSFASKYGKTGKELKAQRLAKAQAFDNAQQGRAANFAKKFGKSSGEVMKTPSGRLHKIKGKAGSVMDGAKSRFEGLRQKGAEVMSERHSKQRAKSFAQKFSKSTAQSQAERFKAASGKARAFNNSQASKAANFASKFGKSNSSLTRAGNYSAAAKRARSFNKSQVSKASNFAAKYAKSNAQLTNTPGRNLRRSLTKGRLNAQGALRKAGGAVRSGYDRWDTAYRRDSRVRTASNIGAAAAGFATGRAIGNAVRKRMNKGSSSSSSSSRSSSRPRRTSAEQQQARTNRKRRMKAALYGGVVGYGIERHRQNKAARGRR